MYSTATQTERHETAARSMILTSIRQVVILAKGSIAGADFSQRDNVMWHRPVGSIAVGCSSRAISKNWMIPFAAYTTAEAPSQCFSMGRTTPIIAPSRGRHLKHNLIHGSLGPCESSPKRHLDRFSRFCIAHPCAQHTDTPTTLRAASIATGRIYAMHVMQPNNVRLSLLLLENFYITSYSLPFSVLSLWDWPLIWKTVIL